MGTRSTIKRGVVTATLAAIALLVAPTSAHAINNITPANGAVLTLSTSLDSATYVVFQIEPDANRPCSELSYFLEVDGRTETFFGASCGTILEAWRIGKGTHSWRAWRYCIADSPPAYPDCGNPGAKRFGPITTFVLQDPPPPPPTPPYTLLAPADGSTVYTSTPTFRLEIPGPTRDTYGAIFISAYWQRDERGYLINARVALTLLATAPGSTVYTATVPNTSYYALYPGVWYWQWASPLSFSPTYSFTVAATPPAQPPTPPATPPATLNQRPTVRAYVSRGRWGRRVQLRYSLRDDGGETREVITVLRNGRRIDTLRSRLAPIKKRTVYFVAWQAPATRFKGTWRFCVVAYDAEGLASPSSCARLIIR